MIAEYIIIIFFSLTVIKIRKRKMNHIEEINIKVPALFIAVFFVQFLASFTGENSLSFISESTARTLFIILHCFSYQIMLIGIALNMENQYMKLLFAGTLMNFIVIFANGMQMPVKVPYNLKNAWENYSYLAYGKDIIHTVMTSKTKLKFLGDIINIDKPYPWPKSVSIGDLVLLSGVAWFFREESTKKSEMEM